MKVLNLVKNDDPEAPSSARLELVEKDIPEPGPGQVLIKMEAASCNPSDLYYMRGEYGVPPDYGCAAGLEGAGIVVKAGRGLIGWRLRGKRVACVRTRGGDGVWAEYFLTDAKSCLPINKAIPAEQAATFLVNPITALGLLERARALGSSGVIQNAAASQVGRMVIRLAKTMTMPVISVVRREEQKELLLGIGAAHVLVTSAPSYEEELRNLAKELKIQVLLDAVAGTETARTLMCMPNRSTAIVYGVLSRQADDPYGGSYPAGNMIFAGARVEGYWLVTDMARLGALGILKRSRKLQKMFAAGELKTAIQSRSSLEDYPAAIDHYAQNMSAGKAILVFDDG